MGNKQEKLNNCLCSLLWKTLQASEQHRGTEVQLSRHPELNGLSFLYINRLDLTKFFFFFTMFASMFTRISVLSHLLRLGMYFSFFVNVCSHHFYSELYWYFELIWPVKKKKKKHNQVSQGKKLIEINKTMRKHNKIMRKGEQWENGEMKSHRGTKLPLLRLSNVCKDINFLLKSH